MKGDQLDLLGEIDAWLAFSEKMKEAAVLDRLRNGYIRASELFGHNVDNFPDGLVVIQQTTRYLAEGQKQRFYRCVIGHHRTVAGRAAHIISAPDEEWPDVPAWSWDNRHGCQWTYPTGINLWITKEPVYDSVKWTE